MSYILNIDTATEVCSVCISKDGKVISIRESEEKYEHASLITNYINETLNAAGITAKDLSAVAISSGPGSYTGLRIGASAAKGLCFGLDIPLIAIDTLEALAYGIKSIINQEDLNFLLAPMIDARRMEVYTAVYDAKLECIKNTSPVILDNNSYLEFLNRHNVYFGGNGAKKFKALINHPNANFTNVNNSSKHMIFKSFDMFKEQNFENVIYYEPFYLKGVNINVSDNNYF